MQALPKIDGGVLVVGDVMTDIIVQPEGPLVVGSDRRAKISAMAGGSAANQAVWMGHYGVPVSLFARVGADDVPQLQLELRRAGVRPILAGDAVHQTGRLITLVDPDGERSFLTDRGANLHLAIEGLPSDWWSNVGLLQLSGYSFFEEQPRKCAQSMMTIARQQNIPIAIDPASAGFIKEVDAEVFLDWVAPANILFANAEEAEVLTGSTDVSNQLGALGARFDYVVIKQGQHGAAIGTAQGVLASDPGTIVSALDSTGAGDAFLAGFVTSWHQNADFSACLRAGNHAGALAVQKLGGRP